MSEPSKMPVLDGLTAIDRLRLYATDPETFSFDIDDAIAALEKYEEVERRADIAEQMAEALREIIPFIPKSSASEGGPNARSANVAAADKVRAALTAWEASNG